MLSPQTISCGAAALHFVIPPVPARRGTAVDLRFLLPHHNAYLLNQPTLCHPDRTPEFLPRGTIDGHACGFP